jgi:hypothetical protein
MATFNVKAYGATGDGVTDDTQAMQAAIEAAAAGGGGTVYVGPGTYRVSEGASADGTCLRLLDGVRLLGIGMDKSIIAMANGATGVAGIVRAEGNHLR